MSNSIRETLREAAADLAAASDTAKLDAEVLLTHVLGENKTYLYTWPERCLTAEQADQFAALLQRRQSGEPVAHLTGYREFWSLELKVSSDTLIPRPETELLVEVALELFSPDHPVQMIDLGTGTGAIALALAAECSTWQVTACDRVTAAVELAERNRQRLALDNVTVIASHWFSSIPDGAFDLVISNPPYIDGQDPHLNEGDVRFEPRSALVADQAGLQDIQLIAEQARGRLNPEGWLLLEHGHTQGKAVRNILTEQGFVDVQTRQDLAGLDRATFGRMP